MKVSLVIATVRRSYEIERLFDSLVAQTSSEFEVIIVDQNSDDRLLPHIEAGRARGLYIRHERLDRPNLSGARNRGIMLARHQIVAFPDDDCWYDNRVIEILCSTFRSEPKVDCVVGKWVERSTNEEVQPSLFSRDAWRKFRGGDASSISLFIRREFIERLGGFDEKLGIGCWYGGAEETDLVMSAMESGAQILYFPSIEVHHLYNPEPTGQLISICRQTRLRERGTGAIYAKHRLSFFVILRGFVAPILLNLLRFNSPANILRGAFSVVGRIEGYLRWRFYR